MVCRGFEGLSYFLSFITGVICFWSRCSPCCLFLLKTLSPFPTSQNCFFFVVGQNSLLKFHTHHLHFPSLTDFKVVDPPSALGRVGPPSPEQINHAATSFVSLFLARFGTDLNCHHLLKILLTAPKSLSHECIW